MANYTNARIIFNNNLPSSTSIENGKRQFPPQNISGIGVSYGKSLQIEPYGQSLSDKYPKYVIKEYINDQWQDRELYYYAYDTNNNVESTSSTYCKKDIINNKLYIWVWNSSNSDGKWQEVSYTDNGITFYFDNTNKKLSKVNYYVWNNNTSSKFAGEWPGTTASNINGTNIYTLSVNSNNIIDEVSSGNVRVIINDGTSQTKDIIIPSGTRIVYVNKDSVLNFYDENGNAINHSNESNIWK